MKTQRHPKRGLRKSISFGEAIARRAKHPGRRVSRSHHRDTTAHDLAVADGRTTPMMHYTDVAA